MNIPSAATGELDPIPTIPILPNFYPNNPSDPTLSDSAIFKPGPTGGCADKDAINTMPPTPSLIHFLFEMFSISLTLFIFFLTVAWVTVLWETQLMKDQVLSDANGVSSHTY